MIWCHISTCIHLSPLPTKSRLSLWQLTPSVMLHHVVFVFPENLFFVQMFIKSCSVSPLNVRTVFTGCSGSRWALLVYCREPYCNTTESQADMTPDPCPTFRCLWHAAAERQVAISGIQLHNEPLMASKGMFKSCSVACAKTQFSRTGDGQCFQPICKHRETHHMHFFIHSSLFMGAQTLLDWYSATKDVGSPAAHIMSKCKAL